MAHITHFPNDQDGDHFIKERAAVVMVVVESWTEGEGTEEFQNQPNQTNSTSPPPPAHSPLRLCLNQANLVCLLNESGLESSLSCVNKPEEINDKEGIQFKFKSEANQLICLVQCGILSSHKGDSNVLVMSIKIVFSFCISQLTVVGEVALYNCHSFSF